MVKLALLAAGLALLTACASTDLPKYGVPVPGEDGVTAVTGVEVRDFEAGIGDPRRVVIYHTTSESGHACDVVFVQIEDDPDHWQNLGKWKAPWFGLQWWWGHNSPPPELCLQASWTDE